MSDVKRLYRSRRESKLAGVCGGVADYLEADPTVVRVVFLLGTMITGFFPGIFIYLVMWVIMPEEPLDRDAGEVD